MPILNRDYAYIRKGYDNGNDHRQGVGLRISHLIICSVTFGGMGVGLFYVLLTVDFVKPMEGAGLDPRYICVSYHF